MYIHDSPNVDQDEMRQKRHALAGAFPQLRFGRDGEMIFNHITGYAGYESERSTMISVFPHCSVAVLNDTFPDEAAAKLESLGYRVPARRSHVDEGPIYKPVPGEPGECYRDSYDAAVTPYEILWEELKAGFGHVTIKKNLDALFASVIPPGARELEFAVYYLDVLGTSDNPIYYVRYRELFKSPPENVAAAILDKLPVIAPHDAIAMSSRVLTDAGDVHIPMIDFLREVDPSPVMKRIGAPDRVLVYSGNSYHHYNTGRFLSQVEFVDYMSQLSQQPEIGKVWPQLQAEQGFALLRVIPSASKPFYPEVDE